MQEEMKALSSMSREELESRRRDLETLVLMLGNMNRGGAHSEQMARRRMEIATIDRQIESLSRNWN